MHRLLLLFCLSNLYKAGSRHVLTLTNSEKIDDLETLQDPGFLTPADTILSNTI